MGRFYPIVAEVGLGRVYDSSPPYERDSLDCSRFTYAVLVRLLPWLDLPRISKALHLDYTGALGAFGNVAALVDIGAAVHASSPDADTDDTAARGLYYGQGWRGNSGHNFFAHRRKDGTLWIVEVTNYAVGGQVERRWCRQVTEAALRHRYPELRFCRLLTTKDPR